MNDCEKIYWLMLKTHIDTGLNYLCYTTKIDPYSYTGSGKRWKNHLKKHGIKIGNYVVGVYDNESDLINAGRRFSEFWNIVESENFANLRVEEGDGGDTSTFINYANI